MSFASLYRRLNAKQKLAVDTLEGPVMVLAGPGTGKTQVLTLRIANILKTTDTPPYAITALTYTEAAADNMIRRLSDIIGPAAYQVNIFTFHALAGSIIKQHPDKFPHLRAGRPINIIEKINLIEDLLSRHRFHLFRPIGRPGLYVKSLIQTISQLKREAISPEQFNQQIKQLTDLDEAQLKKLTNLARFYQLYQEKLTQAGWYDFEDMINYVVEGMQTDPELSMAVQEKVFYLLIDEYQDTNSAQNKLILALSSFWGQKANVFVVGDDDQSIFRFQGASRANFVFFTQLFPQAKIINLELNYRSQAEIIAVSEAFINPQRQTLSHHLRVVKTIKPAKSPTQPPKPRVRVHTFASLTQEAEFITQQIKRLIGQGVKPENIGLIYRENKDALVYAPFLAKENIPYMIEGQVSILNQPSVAWLINLLKVINHWGQETAEVLLYPVLNYDFFHLKPALIGQAFQQANSQRLSFFQLYLKRPRAYQSIWQVMDSLEKLKKDSLSLPLPLFIQTLLDELGITHFLIDQATDKQQLFYLYTFFNQIKTWYRDKTTTSLDQLMSNLELLETHQIALEAEPLFTNQAAVKLLTAHKAKGQEFDYVFIPQFINQKWSRKRVPQLIKLPPEIILSTSDYDPGQDQEKEAERLFYVAMTRAKQQATITIPETIWVDGVVKKVQPALFVHQLDQKLVSFHQHQDSPEKLEKLIISLFKPAALPQLDREWWQAVVDKLRLSPTALNTYLNCPYQFLLNNLFRLPRVKSPSLILGSAIHRALENWLINYLSQPKSAGLDQLIRDFQEYLEHEILIDTNRQQLNQQGQELLTRFYQTQLMPQLSKSTPLQAELDFSLKPVVTPEGVLITGKIDRVDQVGDNQYLVIDYKTGRIPTKKDLTDPNQDYHRQLVFYALLIDSLPQFKGKQIEFGLWFLGDKRRRPLLYRFRVSQSDKLNLRRLIKQTADSIKALEFGRTTNRRVCQRCAYRFHCFPNGLPPQPPEAD